MKIQGVPFAVQGNVNMHFNKRAEASNGDRTNNKTDKPGTRSNGSVSVSANSQLDKMIENVQEQIKKIQESDRYDADTKKDKIKELEDQLKEIEKLKTEALNESPGAKKNSEGKSTNNNSKASEKSKDSGVIVDISLEAKALLEADNSLKHLKSANSTKVRLEGESNVLASEINIDKSRGIDTSKKEEQLERIRAGVQKSMEKMGENISDINSAADDISNKDKVPDDTDSKDSTEHKADDDTEKLN